MEEWLLMQTFYHGLIPKPREQLDATAKGSFVSLTPRKDESLMDKIAENQCWTYNSQTCCWHFLASLLKIDYKSIISNGTKNVGCWYTITIVTSER